MGPSCIRIEIYFLVPFQSIFEYLSQVEIWIDCAKFSTDYCRYIYRPIRWQYRVFSKNKTFCDD